MSLLRAMPTLISGYISAGSVPLDTELYCPSHTPATGWVSALIWRREHDTVTEGPLPETPAALVTHQTGIKFKFSTSLGHYDLDSSLPWRNSYQSQDNISYLQAPYSWQNSHIPQVQQPSPNTPHSQSTYDTQRTHRWWLWLGSACVVQKTNKMLYM